ncbi:hypothetical protein A2U01_0072137 [Trifolium medium]|uniref:Uncharacterized protein n=1 Tax=Trifolium medium TaxID=97028 RepID=A0A392SPU3_9FABA|nr:hypothetical protein [Trifolium medium]
MRRMDIMEKIMRREIRICSGICSGDAASEAGDVSTSASEVALSSSGL